MKKKAFIASALSIAVSASLVAGFTLSAFDYRSDVNVSITSSVIDINAYIDENSLVTYSFTGEVEPDGSMREEMNEYGSFHLGGTATIEEDTLVLNNMMPGDSVSFTINVENLNDYSNINYRTVLSCGVGEQENIEFMAGLEITIDGKNYSGLRGYNTAWEKMPEEDFSVYVTLSLPVSAGTEYAGLSCTVIYAVQAMQSNAGGLFQIPSERSTYINSEEELTAVLESNEYEVLNLILNKDITLNREVEISKSNVTLDMRGHTILLNGALRLKDATLSLRSGTLGSPRGIDYVLYAEDSTVELNGITVYGGFSFTGETKVSLTQTIISRTGGYALLLQEGAQAMFFSGRMGDAPGSSAGYFVFIKKAAEGEKQSILYLYSEVTVSDATRLYDDEDEAQSAPDHVSVISSALGTSLAWRLLQNAAQNGGTIALQSNMQLLFSSAGTLTVTPGVTLTILLNGYVLTTTRAFLIGEGATLNISGGGFRQYVTSSNGACVTLSENATVNVREVTVRTNGYSYYLKGKGSTLNIVGSQINNSELYLNETTWPMVGCTACIGTSDANNASEENPAGISEGGATINLIDSVLNDPSGSSVSNYRFCDSAIILLSPVTLRAVNSSVHGRHRALVIRCGNATLENCRLYSLEAGASDTDSDGDWGNVDSTPAAPLIIGSKGYSYGYSATCTLKSTAVFSPDYYGVYLFGEEDSATLNYDSKSTVGRLVSGGTKAEVHEI